MAEAADVLRVSRKTIQRMRQRGELTDVQVGPRLIRLHMAEIEAMIGNASGDVTLDPADVSRIVEDYRNDERPGRHPNARETSTADAGDGRGSG